MVGTTFTGNSCSSGYGGGGGSLGGALSTSAGNVTVINGGFYNNNAVSPTIYNYAFASLTAGTAFGGGIYQADGTLNLIATTLATNYERAAPHVLWLFGKWMRRRVIQRWNPQCNQL